MQEAAELSHKLWTRKARIEVKDFDDLQHDDGATPKYDSISELFEPHPVHTRALAQDPKALDGRKIVLLCSPLILTAGDTDGQNYGKTKILKKAVVWLG